MAKEIKLESKLRLRKPPDKVGNFKIMTVEEIVKEHPEFEQREVFDRWIYTKIKYLEKSLDKQE